MMWGPIQGAFGNTGGSVLYSKPDSIRYRKVPTSGSWARPVCDGASSGRDVGIRKWRSHDCRSPPPINPQTL